MFLYEQAKRKRSSALSPQRNYQIGTPETLTHPESQTLFNNDPFERFKGIDYALSEIREFIDQASLTQEELDAAEIDASRSILLYGPSGVG